MKIDTTEEYHNITIGAGRFAYSMSYKTVMALSEYSGMFAVVFTIHKTMTFARACNAIVSHAL